MSEVDTLEQEVEENPLAGLVQAALDKDYNKANELFGQAISVKLDDVIDQERIKVAGSIYNGEEDDVEDPDDSEDDSEVEDSEAEDDMDDDEENSSE